MHGVIAGDPTNGAHDARQQVSVMCARHKSPDCEAVNSGGEHIPSTFRVAVDVPPLYSAVEGKVTATTIRHCPSDIGDRQIPPKSG